MEVVYSSRKERRSFESKNTMQQQMLLEFGKQFSNSCLGKTEKEIFAIYKSFDARWVAYANKTNKTKQYTVYADAFEQHIDEFIKEIPKLKGKVSPFIFAQYDRIYDTLRRKNVFQRVCKVLKNHFFVKNG